MKRVCAKCKNELDVSKFNIKKHKSGNVGYQPYCIDCQKEYKEQHYLNNKEKYIAKARKYDEKIRKIQIKKLLEYFSEHPCIDCGETDPLVLEFDHRDPNDKYDNVARMLCDYNWEKVIGEINKCDVRCANCHKRKTAKQFNFYMYRILNENNSEV